MKLIKQIEKLLRKFEINCKIFRKILIIGRALIFKYVKNKAFNVHMLKCRVREAEPPSPEGSKLCRKFVENGNVKFKILITFQKCVLFSRSWRALSE